MALAIEGSAIEGFGTGGGTGSATTDAITTPTSGNLIIVGTVNEGTSADGTVSDNKGNGSPTKIGTTRTTDYPSYINLWYWQNAAGGTGHTFTMTKSSGYPSIAVVCVSGANTSGALDQNNGASNDTTSPVTSGSITTTQADEILIGFTGVYGYGTLTYTANNGFTKLQELPATTSWQCCLSYRIVSATLTTEASFGLNSSFNNAGTLISSFKAAAGTPDDLVLRAARTRQGRKRKPVLIGRALWPILGSIAARGLTTVCERGGVGSPSRPELRPRQTRSYSASPRWFRPEGVGALSI